MKKLLVVMLVLTFVLAATTAALAGRGRWDNDATTPNYVKYADLNASYKYPVSSPHGGYLTSTNLCSFCHAVHNAGTDGNGTNVFKLTRSTTGTILGACNYCHYTGGIATRKPYDTSGFGAEPVRAQHTLGATVIPDSTLGTAPLNDGVLDCFDCHNAAPHAANAVFKMTKDAGAGTDTYYQICKRCHDKNYTTGYNAKTHVMKTAAADGGATSNGRTGNPIVKDDTTSSSDCLRCHKSKTDGGVGLFPHISNAARFLTSAAGDLNVAGTGGQLDVVCLNCHRWNGAASGVGLTF